MEYSLNVIRNARVGQEECVLRQFPITLQDDNFVIPRGVITLALHCIREGFYTRLEIVDSEGKSVKG